MNSVLVIEGDAATRGAICDLIQLEWPGFTIHSVDNGEAGILLAQQHKPDLILIESDLPGISGYQTVLRLRHMPETSTTPLIAITSSNVIGNKPATNMCAACNAWLVKPFSGQRLIQIIRPFTLHLAHMRRTNQYNGLLS